MAGSSSSTSTEDIRKMGQLVKIKTNKKKYFVLRDETKSSSARLEYYDSEKKWRSGFVPKRTIVLKNCFNINAKPDARHKHAIALYTKDDCFAVSCQSEDEQQDWLTNMIELRNRNLDENTATRPLFEHIWPVTVKSRGLGGNERKVIPGQYRLCLTNKDLSLIRVNNDQSDIVLPLDCIRRCGHTHQFFFLELGRSAITGSGSLWLQVEDMVISQNIHEALLSSMKNNEVPTSGIFRVRSGSSAMENRKRASMAPTGGSSTLHTQPKRAVSVYTSNPSPNAAQSETSVRKSSLSESAMQNSVLSGRRAGTTIEEEPVKPCHYMTINPMIESPTVEIVTGSDGLRFPNAVRGDEMASFQTSKPPVIAAAALSPSCSEMTYGDHSDYVPMVTPTGESYMVMAARRYDDCLGLGLEPHGSSSSVSSAMSSAGSMSVLESSDRSFHSHSLSHLQEVAAADGGYIEMTSPQNLTERSSFPLRPDNVPCYVRDEGAEEFPKRAYSVGSKPVPVVNKPLNNSYIDMSGKSNAKKEAEKSSSAPHLNDDDEKKRELSDLFMELDFNRSKRDVNHKGASEFRGRASSGGSRELRMKAMSFGAKEAIQRFSLFSKTKPSAAQQHSDARRPRTSTICQESLRPRTSSFGPSDQRPRSSSGGNACFVDVMSRQLQVGGEPSSSQDSLRRHGKRPSQERIKSGQSDAYVNMNLGRRSTEWLKMAESDAGYMDMKPSEDVGEPNYMRMSAGTSGPAPAATTSGESVSARPSLGVTMKPKLEVVDAGGSKDYLAMTPGGASQSKLHGVASSNRPRVKVTKSTDETNSSYMEMAPRGASSEKSVEANSERKDVHLSRKYDDYMEMSVGGSGKHRDTSAASNQAQNVAADAHATSERARGSVVLASSPNREDFKGSGRQLSASPKEDIPPPPFDLSFPSPSFFLRADQAAPTIPGQSPASRTEPQTAAGGSASERLSGQISYATLDLGSSVDHCPAAPLAEGRGGTGAVGRGRSFGQGSHQHVYAQIDFDKTEDRQE